MAKCTVVKAGALFISKQGLSSAPAISADSVGSAAIHMQLLTIPPGVRAKAHKHAAHETAIYVISGEAHMDYGERLEQHLVVRAGDFLYIPADVPHRPYNASLSVPCLTIIALPHVDAQAELLKRLPRLLRQAREPRPDRLNGTHDGSAPADFLVDADILSRCGPCVLPCPLRPHDF